MAATTQNGGVPLPFEAQAGANAIRAFLEAELPVRVVEERQLLLTLALPRGGFELSSEGNKVVLHLWSPERSLVRRIVGIEPTARGLRLAALRFGQGRPTPLLLQAGPLPAWAGRQEEFRQTLWAAVQREWPEWRGAEAAGAPRHPALAAFLLRRGFDHLACLGVTKRASPAVTEGALTQLLLWGEELEATLGHPLAGLRLVLPTGHAASALFRRAGLRWREQLEIFTLDGSAGRLVRAAAEEGNLRSVLRRAPPRALQPAAAPAAWTEIVAAVRQFCPHAVFEDGGSGGPAAHLHGLTFARATRGRQALLAPFEFLVPPEATGRSLRFRPLTRPAWEAFYGLLRRLDRERRPDGARRSPLYLLHPEAWMEEALRDHITALDAYCDSRFLYSQVPAFCRGQRDVVDILAAHRDGRLCVFELKAEEDLSFPLQALDYWHLVRRHQEQGDFARLGYFPGLRLRTAPPLLTLVAPALRWHPRLDSLLHALAPEVPLERLGVNENWREEFLVVERYLADRYGQDQPRLRPGVAVGGVTSATLAGRNSEAK